MAKVSEEKLEKIRTAIVEVLLEVRRVYLREDMKRALKHWETLENRALSAARRSGSMDEWMTLLCRGLQIPTLDSSGCSAVMELSHLAREHGQVAALDLVERETRSLMAIARLAAEQRRDEKDAAKAAKEANNGLPRK